MRSRPEIEGLEGRYLLSWTISGQVQIYKPGADGPIYGPSPGSLVYVDLNRNGTHEANEPSATTDSSGNFSLTGRGSGTFRIREQPPPDGTHYKSDETGFRDITISDGQTVSGIVFANSQECTLSGTVFEDLNGNGVQDPGEPGLGGWFVDQQYPHLPNSFTGPGGHWAISIIGAGQWFLSLEPGYPNPFGMPAGWVITAPLRGGGYTVTTTGRDIGNLNFGVKPTPAPGTPAPDLQADSVTANVPSTVYGGESVSGSVAFSNQGNAIALGPMQVSFYAAASNESLQPGDALLGTVPVDVNLAPAAQSQANFTLTLPHNLPSGTFHFTALLNSTFSIPESSADNNRVVGPTFAVAPSGADLSASFAGAVPLVVGAGQHAQVGVSIANVGGADFSGNVTVRLYASSDASLDSGDRLLATVNTGRLSIARAGSTPVSVGFAGPTGLNGYYFLIAQVSSHSESASADVSNNTAVSSTGVLFGSATGANPPPTVGSGQQSGDVALGPLDATFKSMASGPPRTVTDMFLMNATGGTVRRRVRLTLYAVPTGGGTALPVRVLTRQLRLRAGASQRLRLSFRFSRHMPAGSYTLRAELQDMLGKSVGPVMATVDDTQTFTVPARR